MKALKTLILSLLVTLTTNAAVIERAEFISYYHDAKNGTLVFSLIATPLSWVSFYACANAQDMGNFERSTLLGGWYILDYIETVSFLPNNIGFIWMNSTSAPIFK